ncbi:hypothetical protein FQN57_001989 [Myotisia sp. PD_48]|nr:hypothetical protein FQN57_001989 [Myotisia sp. PD_48]
MAGEIRQPFDTAAFERYLNQHAPSIATPLGVKQFGFGQSNPTYQLTAADGKKYVMRKKPPGKLLSKTAHRVDREFNIIHALEKTDVPVPQAIILCEDDSVIGTAFYIMEFLDGRIFLDAAMPEVGPEERTALWKAAVQTLAKLHRVVPKSIGMEGFGRHGGFYDRQLKTFIPLSKTQGDTVDIETKEPIGPLPHFNEMVAFFQNPSLRPQDRSTFVHGDYKIDNMVFHKTEPRVIGVLDWEMATIGHPLSDLCNLTGPFVVKMGPTAEAFQPGKTPGLPTREDCLRWYSEVAGWDPSKDLTWGDAFHGFRGSIIMQGIAARYAVRQASSASAREYGKNRGPYALQAWDRVQELLREVEKKPKL